MEEKKKKSKKAGERERERERILLREKYNIFDVKEFLRDVS